MKKIVFALAILGTVAAQAEWGSSYVGNDNWSVVIGSPMASATPTNSAPSTYIAKMAVINGEEAAGVVLNGGEATDLFFAAAAATQELKNTEFQTERQAAVAVIKLSRELKNTK